MPVGHEPHPPQERIPFDGEPPRLLSPVLERFEPLKYTRCNVAALGRVRPDQPALLLLFHYSISLPSGVSQASTAASTPTLASAFSPRENLIAFPPVAPTRAKATWDLAKKAEAFVAFLTLATKRP